MDIKRYAEELADTLYEALTSSQDGFLSFEQVADIICNHTEFGLRKIEAAGIKRFKEKYPNVIQESNEKGFTSYRLRVNSIPNEKI